MLLRSPRVDVRAVAWRHRSVPVSPIPSVTPTPTQTEGVGPVVQPTPSASPPAAGTPGTSPAGTPSADGGQLAATGGEFGVMAPFTAAALLLAGALLLLNRRTDQS